MERYCRFRLKKIRIIVCFIIVLTLIFCFNSIKKNKINTSIVFIQAVSEESIKDGMGFVYKITDNINYIITNYHVVYDMDFLYVYNLNNQQELAELVAYDEYYDIAVLKIKGNLKLKESQILDSDSVKVNDFVYYYNIKNNNIEKSEVLEINKEINISTNYGNSFYRVVSIMGNIVEGNSGGPVLDKNSRVIGLLSLKEKDSNIAFYVPVNEVMNVVSILENQYLSKPTLGATFVSSSNIKVLNEYKISIPNIEGVVIVDIIEGYPLYNSKLDEGDVIVKIDDISIKSVKDLRRQIYSHDVGEQIKVEYYRNGRYKSSILVLNK